MSSSWRCRSDLSTVMTYDHFDSDDNEIVRKGVFPLNGIFSTDNLDS